MYAVIEQYCMICSTVHGLEMGWLVGYAPYTAEAAIQRVQIRGYLTIIEEGLLQIITVLQKGRQRPSLPWLGECT